MKKPTRLMSAINQDSHFLLTEAVKKTASQNVLTEASILKKPPRLIVLLFEASRL